MSPEQIAGLVGLVVALVAGVGIYKHRKTLMAIDLDKDGTPLGEEAKAAAKALGKRIKDRLGEKAGNITPEERLALALDVIDALADRHISPEEARDFRAKLTEAAAD